MSDKLGVALTKEKCVICCKDVDGAIVMNTRLTKGEAKKVEEMHGKVIGWKEGPCDECKEMMEKAFLFIGIDEDKTDFDNLPNGLYRTGHLVGVKKDIPLVQEFVKEHAPDAFGKGFIFIDEKDMREFGLLQVKE